MFQYLSNLSNIIKPRCCLCEQKLNNPSDIALCHHCYAYFSYVQNACEGCGINLENDINDTFCGRCLSKPRSHYRTICGFWYKEPIRTLIRNFKFNQQLYLTPILTQLMTKKISQYYTENNLEYPTHIIPMPIHPKRLKERGYHQVHELAKMLSKAFNIPINLNACQRVKHTTPQSDLPFQERKKNVQSVFQAKKIASKHIALLDDVITTGETISALSSAFINQNPGLLIDVWSVARTKIEK